MPEAVIVAAPRSPIGRAVKGSLAHIRPDDLAVRMVRAALGQVPQFERDDIDESRLNVNGGSIAGHPCGMTGARITMTLIRSLQLYDKAPALEIVCVGGGQRMAMVLERLS